MRSILIQKLRKTIFFGPKSCGTSFFSTLICEVFSLPKLIFNGRFVGYIEIESGHFFGTAFHSTILQPHFKR